MIDLPPETPIVVTASRAPQEQAVTASSATLLDERRSERLGEPLAASLLRLTPSASLSVSGPSGAQAQVRIRGAEANHTLLFIDGIRANDPSAGNEPRFELLNADLGSRLEVVRGPQSALWGSEAIGGVVSLGGSPRPGFGAAAESGSNGFRRLSATAAKTGERLDAALGAGFQGADGINSFAGGPGDRDGYRNGVVRARLAYHPSPTVELGASGFAVAARSEFDGLDPVTFVRADTRDQSRNRLAAGRLWARAETGGWTVTASASLLGSRNRNLLGESLVNRTNAGRATGGAQVEREFATGPLHHEVIVAADWDRERFHARDVAYGGLSDQDRDRSHAAFTAEWRAEADAVSADLAVRRDLFSRFADATTLRGSAMVDIGRGWSLAASYGEGIAQPTFFDLYGFFPGSFAGNSSLTTERSRGLEGGLRYRASRLSAALTVYRQRLSDEIVDVLDPATFQFTTANSKGRSIRKGVEGEVEWTLSPALRLSANYAFLRASERSDAAGRAVRELRRPRHSGSAALDGQSGRFSYGASIAYTGERSDRDFDLFPAPLVKLDRYWLGGARVAYDLTPRLQLFGRVANAFDQDAQDVVGYRAEGRSAYAGVRLALGR